MNKTLKKRIFYLAEERLDKLKLNQTKEHSYSDKPETLAQLLVQGLQSKDPR